MIKRKNNTTPSYLELGAHLTGRVVPLCEVKDEVFAQKILGDGIAVVPAVGQLRAPADGRVEQVFDTAHALTLLCDGGAELLLHIGIDTVGLGGQYFRPLVKTGEVVKRGDALISFDIDGITAAGYDMTTPMVVSNTDDFELQTLTSGNVMSGQPLLRLSRRKGGDGRE